MAYCYISVVFQSVRRLHPIFLWQAWLSFPLLQLTETRNPSIVASLSFFNEPDKRLLSVQVVKGDYFLERARKAGSQSNIEQKLTVALSLSRES